MKSKGRTSIRLRQKQRDTTDDKMWDRFPWCVPIYLIMLLILCGMGSGIYWLYRLL